MLALYVLILGIILAIIGGMEIIAPQKAFTIWRRWVSHRLFFLHGSLLIIAGFPLTIYNGPLATVIFIIGLFAVLTGPFVLIYPDTIRQMFRAMAEEIKDGDIKKIIFTEGALRIAAGAVCVAGYFLR